MINERQLPILHRDLFIEGEWKKNFIDKLIEQPSEPEDYPNVLLDLHNCLDGVVLDGKKILVVGSITPWIECFLLKNGAFNVDVTDINEIKINDDRITFVKSNELINNEYDLIISFSSIEHAGLGRYGDDIDENGDLNFMDGLHSLLQNNGIFLLGVPVAEKYKVDGIWHRIYDKSRLEILTKKYNIIKSSKNNKVTPYVDFSFDEFYQYDWQNQPFIFLLKK
jgi:hypothetical protein